MITIWLYSIYIYRLYGIDPYSINCIQQFFLDKQKTKISKVFAVYI